MKQIVIFLSFVFCCGCFPKHVTEAELSAGDTAITVNDYPRLASYALLPQISETQARTLGAYYQLVIIGVENQINNPRLLDLLRQIRPDIILVPYLSLGTFPEGQMDQNEPPDGPVHQLYKRITPEMWLWTIPPPQRLSTWPGSWVMNLTNDPWRNLVIDAVKNRTFATHSAWTEKSVFFDEIWWTISWLSSQIDVDQDGEVDQAGWLDNRWFDGLASTFYQMRRQIPDGVVIAQNGMQFPSNRMELINGIVFEDAFYVQNDLAKLVSKLEDASQFCKQPRYNVVNVCGEQSDKALMRSGLALSCIFDAYFFYDRSIQAHDQVWTFPDYRLDLGTPIDAAMKVAPRIWTRDFTKGLVAFNASDQAIQIPLKQKLWNADGKIYAKQIILPARQGVVLYNYRP